MSEDASRPPGKDPKKESNPSPRVTISSSELASRQLPGSIPYATTSPWDLPADDPRVLAREARRREMEESNPYRLDYQRSRSRSPMRSPPPLRQRDDWHEFPPPRLPSLTDFSLPPLQGIQTRSSSIRSTAHASPHEAEASPTPTYRGAMNAPPRRMVYLGMPPIGQLPPPVPNTPVRTPCPTLQSPGTQHRELSSAAGGTGNHDGGHAETSPSANEAEDDQQEENECVCEFCSPCRMAPSPDGMHFRKVISHVFGRNKTSTKLFPEWVWVHYCRKHYQRARYRADQWPFTQCELLLESLNRMKQWGGVRSFELILRRREQLRIEQAESSQERAASFSGLLPSGRRHPTAIVSPVPDWLRQRVGQEMSFGDIRNLIVEIRNHMVQLRQEEKEREANEESEREPKNAGKRGAKKTGKDESKNGKGENKNSGKGENNTAGTNKKSGEIRKNASCVRFPDVEILPRFHQRVIDDALRKRTAKGRATEVVAGYEDDYVDEDSEEDEAQHETDEGYDEPNDELEYNALTRQWGPVVAHNGNTGRSSARRSNAGPSNTGPSGAGTSNAGTANVQPSLSESARRRSERIFLRAVDGKNVSRVSSHGSVKKPGQNKKKE